MLTENKSDAMLPLLFPYSISGAIISFIKSCLSKSALFSN